jgi:hypothetical protein
VKKMREVMAEIDLDFDKYVSLIEYIVFKFSKKIKVSTLVNSAQTGNKAEIEEAQRLLEDAQRSLGVARNKAEACRVAEAEARSAEAENKRCLAELQKEEEAYNGKIAELEGVANDESRGIVKRNKAKAELAALKSEDPLPLRRAKINQGAAVRKSEKAAAAAEAARKEAEDSLDAATAAFNKAEEYLEDVKSRSGSSAGALWWIERDLLEAKKYLPISKGGISPKKK